jgi:alpha-N-arabinofuranosidase
MNQNDLKNISGQIITGDNINSINDFGKPEKVVIKQFDSFRRMNNTIEVKLPSKSIVLIQIKGDK